MHYKRSVLNSPGVTELRRKKRINRKKKIMLFFVLFVVLFIILVFISNIKDLNINKINVKGNIVIDTKEIEESVNKNISGKYLFLFPKKNFVIYPRSKIEKDLKEKFKRIKSVSIDNKNQQNLEITIEEYQGKYLWCGNITPELDSKLEQKCYFADNNGYIFDESPYFSGEIYFKLYGQVTNLESPVGSYYFKDIFLKLIKFKTVLEQIGLHPAYVWLNNQEEVVVGLSRLGVVQLSPSIFMKINSDYQKMAENLQSAMETEPLKTKLEKNYNKLQYIDLRYGNKVYYKFE